MQWGTRILRVTSDLGVKCGKPSDWLPHHPVHLPGHSGTLAPNSDTSVTSTIQTTLPTRCTGKSWKSAFLLFFLAGLLQSSLETTPRSLASRVAVSCGIAVDVNSPLFCRFVGEEWSRQGTRHYFMIMIIIVEMGGRHYGV